MAFTFSINSSIIDVASGTGTLAQLYADAIAHTPGCMTSPSANVYQIEGNRELELSSGVTVTTADGDTLQWNLTIDKYPIFDVQSGSTLNLAQNTTIIGDTNSSHQSYIYLYGTVNCYGTAGNEVVWKNYRSIYVYMYDSTAWNWDYVILRDNTLSSGIYIYFQGGGTSGWDGVKIPHSFTNVSVIDTKGWGYFYLVNGDYSQWTFDNWTIDGVDRLYFSDLACLTLSNWTFRHSDVENLLGNNSYLSTRSRYKTSKTSDFYSYEYNQPLVVLDSCTFDDQDSGSYCWALECGAVYLFKNCTIQNQKNGFRLSDGNALFYGTTTFTNVTNKYIYGNGTALHVRKLNIDVKDSTATAIENATVRIRTKLEKTEGSRNRPYESWCFFTDENGEVHNQQDGDGIYLVEKEESSIGNFVQWSDGTGNNVHIIEVFKDGYAAHSEEIAMTSDKTVSIVLEVDSSLPSTVINNSTIYGSTIY